ncbi:hypothetical protein DARTUKUTA_40 [Bacillus phage vB_BspP_Dartukuta]|nr:hypothetical protein DARTUKUTA_40 [Bacillus phage vB_BspP_Dartukuta]
MYRCFHSLVGSVANCLLAFKTYRGLALLQAQKNPHNGGSD